MKKQKRIWFAIVLPRSCIGYSLDVQPEERPSYRNWVRRRGQRLLGEFATREAAMREIKTWLEERLPWEIAKPVVISDRIKAH
jgi:hypothetical protein